MTIKAQRWTRVCEYHGCENPAEADVFSIGYPAPMMACCHQHLGRMLLVDTQALGSTSEWRIVWRR